MLDVATIISVVVVAALFLLLNNLPD